MGSEDGLMSLRIRLFLGYCLGKCVFVHQKQDQATRYEGKCCRKGSCKPGPQTHNDGIDKNAQRNGQGDGAPCKA